jgi:uncharacterized protein (UPF0332 family)
VNAKDFLALAEALVKTTSSEPSKLRTATSRAYYAAYNVCVKALLDLGFRNLKSSNGHENVIRYLSNSKDDELQKMSGYLASLRSQRNKADYDLNDATAEKENNVTLHVAQARIVINTVERRCKGPNKASIIQAMKVYDNIKKGRLPSN